MVEQFFGGIGKAIDKVGLAAAKVCIDGRDYIEDRVALEDTRKQYKSLCFQIGQTLVEGGNVRELLFEARQLKTVIDEADEVEGWSEEDE